ncbi:PREDICTED: adenomatous polyposis coli protein isoform X1 [Drosophila arizonae]|uniref:Adenomatous polyposis coli protein isoform X1 n=1 Tax=Drosophila arizonae TaxID=7263 RepID=A0ABM1PJ74_DROAR|nr:PREDICTED: adenomatous polyposis coli protein isoform X1 [Drosophila arizonae]XP_017867260.1 PREDICTED: adenomatous polyposis coli protein isoform X1 [Drosophila arizonae]
MLQPTLASELEGNGGVQDSIVLGMAGVCLDDTDIDVDPDADVDVDVDVDVDAVPERKPHFLDYDAAAPPDYEENYGYRIAAGEQLKMDKKFERDGEISDYELAASGYTKKEFTQDDNTLHYTHSSGAAGAKKPAKHFLDENPIPPDYMLAQELREHRSLDRNFERQSAQQQQQKELLPAQRLGSPAGVGAGAMGTSVGSRASRSKEPSYTLSRFLDADAAPPPLPRLPKGTAWTSTSDVDATLGAKVECVYSLLSMLGSNDPLEMSKKFLELSANSQSCATLRRSGCMPLLVQMMHAPDNEQEVRKCASLALHNVVHSHPDEKAGRREAKVLRLLDQIVDYCNFLKTLLQSGGEAIADDSDRHPLAAISSLMKVSFDEEHRHAMCELGALQVIPNLVHLDHAVHGPKPEDQCCNSLRRYALMALTNLTFGDENNKALLCGQKQFMEALVAQLDTSGPDDLLQVTASVLRNLSWRADSNMKAVLNEIGTVTALARAAMRNKSENTLKAILSALWNLSAHCSTNKAEFCAVEGALAFLVGMLSYEGPSKTLKIIENAGGILRNVSSHIAVCEPYRQILRQHNCLAILLQQLKSESLTVVSNSCGTLWNLSARCPEDQKFLWDNGAVPMLRSLIHSKHAMISEGSSSALKNLLNFRPAVQNQDQLDPIARSMGLKQLPTLKARKQKALQQELGERHAETCDNLESNNSTSNSNNNNNNNSIGTSVISHKVRRHPAPTRLSRSALLTKSESRDSVYSAKSDTAYEHLMRSDAAKRQGNFELELEHDVEATEEQPIDYSAKYSEGAANSSGKATTYQETDLDQPTDFSLRYAENQLESDMKSAVGCAPSAKASGEGQEILLMLDDSVKCYQTEDTPYVISNAASVTDLRQAAKAEAEADAASSPPAEAIIKPSGVEESSLTQPQAPLKQQSSKLSSALASGSYTPEKPINYCEEGTPGYFSRYDSLSSLDEPGKSAPKADGKSVKLEEQQQTEQPEVQPQEEPTPAKTNSALETPLMFSRRSSMDSLDVDVANCDDKSSVVSDFSRLASGVISPSELPDSPTQSMPQSPRRTSVAGASVALPPGSGRRQQPLRSVFEDDLSKFNVENTPAQFSGATSLSNLSIVDDDKPMGEDNDVDKEDELLLASCINMGMQRPATASAAAAAGSATGTGTAAAAASAEETTRSYCTEDTPALLSKVGSNTNLSAISMNSTAETQPQRCSLNLSDDVSSNASDSGGGAGAAAMLQQCIRDGMQKPSPMPAAPLNEDPIAMLRRGGNMLPTYLPVSDEMSKYLVEDSPCNFSVVSGLSNLTVGSSLVGPAVQLQETTGSVDASAVKSESQEPAQEQVNRPAQWQDDSLSSLSIDSEDDTNLLSQAIAAGCNRPKSNLGFSGTSATSSKRSSSLCSSSQPIAINAATSACSLNSAMSARKTVQQESYSSVDSSDSNDNQSKSLFELCILNGMYKSKEPSRSQQLQLQQQQQQQSAAHSNPNLKQFDSLPVQLPVQSKRQRHHHHHHHQHQRERERERKDEKLLLECINTGISKKINAVPKNGQATSAAALEPCHPMAATTSASVHSTAAAAAPDVEQKSHAPSTRHNSQPASQQSHQSPRHGIDIDTDAAKSPAPSPEIVNTIDHAIVTGSKIVLGDNDADRSSDESNQSLILDTTVRLDEIPDDSRPRTADKHKDPDLMLKSVERLTLEFVTSAEQLRTGNHNHSQSQSHSHSHSQGNTWNEHTCPNDVSFPSISQTAPVLGALSLDDADVDDMDADATEAQDLHDFAEITPTNETQLLCSLGVVNGDANFQQPNSLDSHTLSDTLTEQPEQSQQSLSSGLNFQLGGQVQSAAARSCEQQQRLLLFNGTSASMMTNSTMIAYEARALADNLQQLQASDPDSNEHNDDSTQLTFSINGSLDLDNVRPPSGMESLNSACNTQPSSLRLALPTKSPRFGRKAFPAGLVARRALGQLAGSAESVNSSCNLLDNIKPPSLMDELLDSMISVDSIQSEVADVEQECSMATTISVSNYETAAGDDQTLTVLQSCCDFDDEEDATMNDEFSSAESTPKQGSTPSPNRRTLTPKQKRRLAKDRYKTYTITGNAMDIVEPNETLQIEIVEAVPAAVAPATPSPRANGRRRGSAERYKTQVIECPLHLLQDDCPSDQLSSMRAMMQQFTYITDIDIGNSSEAPEPHAPADDPPSCDGDQNSETESCHGRGQSPPVAKELTLKRTTPPPQPPVLEPAAAVKVVRGRKKPAYISPYSMQSQRNSNAAAAAAKAKTKTLSPTIAKRNALPSTRLPAKKKATPPPAATRLERQGTFVKDEPTNVNGQVPVVEPVSPTQRASKLPTKRPTTAAAATTKTLAKAASPKRIIAKAAPRVLPPQQKPQQRANTNIRLASAKAAAASRVAAQANRISSTTPPSRSNSNLNGGSAAVAAASAAAVKINQAQSRIANIWKRVDEAKTKTTKTKQISNLRTQQTKSSNTLNGNASRPTLLRSSTFDNTPPDAAAVGSQASGATAAAARSRLPIGGVRK